MIHGSVHKRQVGLTIEAIETKFVWFQATHLVNGTQMAGNIQDPV